MQLDRTLIAVRERGIFEILDLSLHVLRQHWRPIVITFLMGAVPLAILNYFLVSWTVDEYEADAWSIYRYLRFMIFLIFLESQLAGVFTTAYLGKAVFMQKPNLREVARDVARAWLPLTWVQVVLRGLAVVWIAFAMMNREEAYDPVVEHFLMLIVWLYFLGVRAIRPFINEIVLLEKNPLFSKSTNAMTVAQRSKRLHSPNLSDLFGRWIAARVVDPLGLSLAWTMLWFPGVFTNNWSISSPYMLYVGIPLACWMVACFFTVARFLCYLDLRIRQEGWEVELRVRAEAARMRLRMGEQATAPALGDRVKSTVTVVVAAIVICLATAGVAMAQESVDHVEAGADALTSGGDFPWYDSQNDGLRRLEVEPTNPNPNPSNPDWQARTKPATTNNWNLNWFSGIGYFLLWTFFAVIVVLFAFIIWLMVKTFLLSESGVAVGVSNLDDEDDIRRDAYRIEQLPFQLDKTNRADLLAEARRLYEAGDYRGAIIYLFSFQLLLLDRHHLIRLAKGKTNRQYLRETRGFRQIANLLEHVMIPFEDVFFGDHALDRSRFETVWNKLPEFQQLVEKEAPAT